MFVVSSLIIAATINNKSQNFAREHCKYAKHPHHTYIKSVGKITFNAKRATLVMHLKIDRAV